MSQKEDRENALWSQYAELRESVKMSVEAFRAACDRIMLPDRPGAKDYVEAAQRVCLALRAPKNRRSAKLLKLPPCILLGCSISNEHGGGVSYESLDTETEITEAEDGRQDKRVVRTTAKKIVDVREYEAAMKLGARLRANLRYLGRVLHSGTVLIPKIREEKLRIQIDQCQDECAAFNAVARTHRVHMHISLGEVEADEERASQEVASTLQELISDMKQALIDCDVEAIRKAAYSAETYTKILAARPESATDAAFLRDAVKAGKDSAKYLRKQLALKELSIEQIKKGLRTSPVEEARIRFLEYAAPVEVEASAVDSQRWKTLDDAPVKPLVSAVELDTARFENLGLLKPAKKSEEKEN